MLHNATMISLLFLLFHTQILSHSHVISLAYCMEVRRTKRAPTILFLPNHSGKLNIKTLLTWLSIPPRGPLFTSLQALNKLSLWNSWPRSSWHNNFRKEAGCMDGKGWTKVYKNDLGQVLWCWLWITGRIQFLQEINCIFRCKPCDFQTF